MFQFGSEVVFDVVGSYIFVFFVEEWRVIDGKDYVYCWFVNGNGRQCFWVFEVGDGVVNFKIFDVVYCINFFGFYLFYFYVFEIIKYVQVFDVVFLNVVVFFYYRNRLF